jgi:hypothetical protein
MPEHERTLTRAQRLEAAMTRMAEHLGAPLGALDRMSSAGKVRDADTIRARARPPRRWGACPCGLVGRDRLTRHCAECA